MSDLRNEWPAAAELPQPEDVDFELEDTVVEAAEKRARRVYRQLLRAKPEWEVLERAHAPFPYRRRGRIRAFRPRGHIRQLHEWKAYPPPEPVWDWRQRIQMAHPLDQRGCDSCSAFAIAATMTDLATIRHGSLRASLSPAHLHWCVGRADCGTALDPKSLATLARHQPVALWQTGDYPYDPASCSTSVGFGRVGTAEYVYTPEEAYHALQSGPLVVVMDLYDDFWTNFGGKAVYRHTSGGRFSTHSVELVGYDLKQQCWIIKNSEGARWGESGFARIGFGECRILTPGGHLALRLTLA